MKPLEEEILCSDEPSSMEVCTSGMDYTSLTFDPGKSSAATYLPSVAYDDFKFRHEIDDIDAVGKGNFRDGVGKSKFEEVNRSLKFESHHAIMKVGGAEHKKYKHMKVNKNAQNFQQKVGGKEMVTERGTESERKCSDNKQLYEKEDRGRERTESCKTMRILGGKQDKRISKESEKLQSFNQRHSEGREIVIDKNGKMKRVKCYTHYGKPESKKISRDYVEIDRKSEMKVTEHWREASLSCGDSITSLKELLRQPAENDDVTDNLTMTEVGGNSNSLTLYRDSNIEQEEAEDENFIKRTDFQEKETEWIGGLPHKDRLRKESDKALSLGSASVFSLADLDPLLEKEKPFSSGKLTSHDTRNLLVRYIQKILNIMMSSVLKKIFIIVYEKGPCYFAQKAKPLPPLAQKPGMKELPSDETESSAKISEGSLKSLEKCTTEIDKNQDLESAGGSDPKIIVDVEELLSDVDAALERSQDIASQTTRAMDKMQAIVDEWNVSLREFYGEKERKFRCEETLCLKDKPSLRHFHAEVFPVKESVTDVKNMKKKDRVSLIETSALPTYFGDPDKNMTEFNIKGSGKGDKSDWNTPKDSNSGSSSNQGWKKYDGEASEKESRNQDDEKEKDEQEDPTNRDANIQVHGNRMPHLPNEENATYKFRRKETHGIVDETDFMQFLGFLSENDEDIPPDLLNKGKNVEDIFSEVNKCLLISLWKHSPEKELESCSICLYIDSMIQHFGKCLSEYRSQESLICKMCLQLFRLIQTHVQQCVENGEKECLILVCRKISYLIESDRTMIFTKAAKIWKKLKKHLLGFVNVPVMEGEMGEEEEYFSMTPLVSVRMPGSGLPLNASLSRSLRLSTTFSPNLPFIPEDNKDLSLNIKKQEKTPPAKPISKSEPICRRRQDGLVEMLTGPRSAAPASRPINLAFPDKFDGKPFSSSRLVSPVGSSGLGVVGPPDDAFSVLTPSGAKRLDKVPEKRPLKVSFSNEIPKEKVTRKLSNASSLPSPIRNQQGAFALTDVDLDAHPEQFNRSQPTENEDIDALQPTSISELSESSSLGDKKTYGEQLHSMPMNRTAWRNEDQILSLVDRPTGVPGIGEVVYGERDIFRRVIRYWMDLKMEFKEYGRLTQKQIREEGVIFPDCRKQLMIMKSRYQKNFQWIRLTHLGRGMSGNCHLASDYNSDYQFCIKKIHISKYQEEELLIWSDLEHPSIVKLHGALRRKEKIYIISEFIGGGSLTETINVQKRMTRRLSHWMALNYFKQVLKVLKYLQKKNVLHEDLKADNILLRSDSHKIAIADFGVAVRIHGNMTPPGYTTKGTPTQFSPEKAMGAGHSYKADLWAAVCILVHMLSGSPPWVKRFPNARMLNFLIVEKDPPVEDVPKNVSIDVMDLIVEGFQKDPKMRTSVNELLQHRAFGLLDSTPDTFTSTLLTSIHQLPDTQLPVESHIRQEQSAIIEQIEHDIRNPPTGGTTSLSSKDREGAYQKGTMAVLLNNNVDLRENMTKLGHTQPELNVSMNNSNQAINLHGKEKIVPNIEFHQSSKVLNDTEKDKDRVMKADTPVRSLDDFRMDSMRKAMAADKKEFMPDKSQKQDLINNFINDNFINDDNDIEVYLATGTNAYTPLPEYEASGSEGGVGSESLGGASGGAKSEPMVGIPELEILLESHSPNDESSDYIDELHNIVLKSQLSRTSTASRSDEDMKRSVSRSSSQMYSDADKEYQDLFLKKLIEEQENDVFNENKEPGTPPDDEELVGTSVKFERSNESKSSDGEPLSSQLPLLTPFSNQSEEKTPEAIAEIGNLPAFIGDFNTSDTTLSENSRNSKSVDLQTITNGKREENENKNARENSRETVTENPMDKLQKPVGVTVPQKREQENFVTEKAKNEKLGKSPSEVQTIQKKIDFTAGLNKFELHTTKMKIKKNSHSETGPQSLPAMFSSTNPKNVANVAKEPMSMFPEVEECLSDDLFGDEAESEPSQLGNSPNQYNEEITMAAYSPNESSSSEISFNKVQKFPNKSFEPFIVEEERPFIGNPSIYIEGSDLTQVTRTSGTSSHGSDGIDSSYRRPNPRQLAPLDVNKKTKDLRKNRLSTPSFPVASPVTPQKFSTPQVTSKSSPFLGLKKTDTGLGSSIINSPPNQNQRVGYRFPKSGPDSSYHSTSPRSWSQVDENDRKIQGFMDELSQASNDSFIVHKDIDNPGIDFEDYNEENFEESLHYTMSQYIQTDDDEDNTKSFGIKVKIELPNKSFVEYRLTAEYYKTEWLKIIERDISAEIHQRGLLVFTLYNGEVPLDLGNSPSDLENSELLHLLAVDVQDNRNDYSWHCEGGMCKNEHGFLC